MDEYGYPYYTMINDATSRYTDKDLIEPQTEKHKEEMGNKKKQTIYVDILRYCIMIPQEEIGYGDIVLEYGIVPYQEKIFTILQTLSFHISAIHGYMTVERF